MIPVRGYKNCEPNDLIMISDIDEIPNPKKIVEFDLKKKYACLLQKNFQSKLNLLNITEKNWPGTKICQKKNLKSPQWLRNIKTKKVPFWNVFRDKEPQIIKDAGWHFSFLKKPAMIRKKIISYSHQEFNSDNFTDTESIKKRISNGQDLFDRKIEYKTIEIEKPFFEHQKTILAKCEPQTHFNKNINLLIEKLNDNISNKIKSIISCSSNEQEDRFYNLFEEKFDTSQIQIIKNPIHEGFCDLINKVEIFTDHQIFNRYHKFKSKTKFSDKQSITLKQITNLKIGDYVTHIDHGIGEFNGLHKISNNDIKQEVIKLSYKGGDILYISIHALHKISKYSAKEGSIPKINQLGTPAWSKSKEKTKGRIKK